MNDDTYLTPSARAAFRSLAAGESGVILHLDSGAYYELNAIGAKIWEILGEGSTLGRLVDDLRLEVSDAPQDLQEDVEGFLRDLSDLDLVSFRESGSGERST